MSSSGFESKSPIGHLDDLLVWRRVYPMVYVDDLADLRLVEEDYHHLHRSLRVAVGDPISVSDAAGQWLPATFGETAEALAEPQTELPRPWAVTVAFVPVKGQKPEWIVQKLTELGVDHIVPLQSERSVVRWDDRRTLKQQDRWSRIIREAGMQSRSICLPSFESQRTVHEFVGLFPDACLADPDGQPSTGNTRTVMIGPEGGWAPREREGRPLVSLPGGVLRAETAAVVAGAMLVQHRDHENI